MVEGAHYLGVMRIDELQGVPHTNWSTERVYAHMRTDLPIIEPHVSLRDALHSMEEADVDLLPVVRDGAFIGVVTTTEILELDEILSRSPRNNEHVRCTVVAPTSTKRASARACRRQVRRATPLHPRRGLRALECCPFPSPGDGVRHPLSVIEDRHREPAVGDSE